MFVITLLSLSLVGVVYAANNECDTDPGSDTTSCCTDVLGTPLCANITWVPPIKAVKVTTAFGALQLLSYTFTQNKCCSLVENRFLLEPYIPHDFKLSVVET
jgi:hypothetical protein